MKKRWFRGFLLMMALVLLAVHFVGLHYGTMWVNDNGKDLLGRKLKIESIGLNYLTAAVTVHNAVLYEDDDTTPFVSFNELYVNVGLLSILNGDGYVIESVAIDGFDGTVDYLGGGFNFDSLIEHLSSPGEKEEPKTDDEPIRWNVASIALSNSTFTYHDLKIGEELTVEDINITLPNGLGWNKLGVAGNADLTFKSGGDLKAHFEFDNDYSEFKTDLQLLAVENKFLLPYIQDFLFVSGIEGSIGMDIHLAGSLTTPGDLDLSGIMRLDETVMYDMDGNKLFGIGGLKLAIDSINPSKDIYAAQTIRITNPYGWFQLYEDGNNLSYLLKDVVVAEPDSSALVTDSLAVVEAEPVVSATDHSSNFFLLIGDYVKQAMQDIQVSDFRLDTLSIKGLSFDFEDHTLRMPFAYSTHQAELHSYGITSASDSVMVYSSAILGDAGRLDMEARLDPTLHEDFKVNLQLNEMALTDVSPYMHHFLGHRVEKGALGFKADVDIQSGKLNSLLHLRIDSLEISEKDKHEDALKLPVKLAVKVLKGRSGIIDLEVPVEGDLTDPEYKLGKAIGKIFKNLITKSANKSADSTSVAPIDSLQILPQDSLILPVDSVETSTP